MRTVTLMSDIHLEFGQLNMQTGGDILAIVGDICVAKDLLDATSYTSTKNANRYHIFFDRCHRLYDTVLYIMGNHEHYGFDVLKTEELLRSYFKTHHMDNIYVLENGTHQVGKTVFLGTTLWTDMDKASPSCMWACERGISDFHESLYNGLHFKPQHAMDMHEYAHGFIRKVAMEHKDEELVVLTHMAPTYKSIHPMYAGNRINGFYASDLSETILDNPNIRYWCHGHVHTDFDYMVGDTRVMCNPRGYLRHEARASNYNMEFTFDIEG